MRQVRGSEPRRPTGEREPVPAPHPDVLRAVGNHALSRWLLQRNYETAAAELGAIDPGVVSGTTPVFAGEHRAVEAERRAAMHEELLEAAPLDDPMTAIDALKARRGRVEQRHLESAQQEGHAIRREGDAQARAALEARETTAGAALTSALTAAATVLADCTALQKLHASNPSWTEYEAGSRKVLDDAKAAADARAAELTSVKTDVKGARDGMAGALGSAPKEVAITRAEQVAKEVAELAAATAEKLLEHKTAVDGYVAAAGTRATGPEREDLRSAALKLGLPETMAAKVLRDSPQGSKGEIGHKLKTTREAYQSVPGATLVTRVLGLGVTHRGANTCGIDNIGSVAGKRVHLTLYWDQVPADPVSLNQDDATILDTVLGTDATGCMHVTAEVYGPFSPNNPSYYWKGAAKQINGAAGTLAITPVELRKQLKERCDEQIVRFTTALATKRTELGAKAP